MTGDATRPVPRVPGPLTPERWRALEPLFDAAIELAPERRRAFLVEACAGDAALHAELESLLAEYDRHDSTVDRPAAARFASLLDEDRGRLPAVLGGAYRITREVGRGGMATVYLAWDLRHERNVAVKVFRPDLAMALGPDRFLAEIKTTARLQHPHILALHDSGTDEGFLYYVMPYVEGESLRHRLEREKQLPVDEAVRIGCEVASALEAAHGLGIVHRDIKPENILLQNGTALVTDFGIALAVSEAAPRLTQTGLAMGTPLYMSPEQATGAGPVDHRADIYALGTVVYEMLAGEPPFTGGTAVAVMAKRAATPAPPLRILRNAVPPAIEAVVARALARESADRHRTAEEFGEALQLSYIPGEAPTPVSTDALPARPDSVSATPIRRARNVAVGTLAALAVLAAAWFVARRTTTFASDANRIVVAPFRVAGDDSASAYLAEGPAVLLAQMLDGAGGGPSAVDPRMAITTWNRVSRSRPGASDVPRDVAREVRAGRVLLGNVLLASGRLTLTASIVDPERGVSHSLAPVSGSPDSLPALLDGLLRQVLVQHAGAPERTVGEFTTQSLAALRAYLDGFVAYRRARSAEAIRSFNLALDLDSTFARAALDLATATGTLLRQSVCVSGECSWIATMPGIRDVGARVDNLSFDRGVRLAWRYSAKLGPRDLPLLEALRANDDSFPSDAKATLAGLKRAAQKAPDRADTRFLVGLILLTQGRALGYSDALAQAEGSFSEARRLDSTDLAPLARMVDVAAYQGDTAGLRRLGAQYLARDSTGATADYVWWRVAAGTNNVAMLRRIHARFDSLDVTTLKQIITASQMSGVLLDDADRATDLVIGRTTDPAEREGALYFGNVLAVNRGRPQRADSLLRLRAEADAARFNFWRSTTQAAMLNDGLGATGAESAREREQQLARDTLGGVARRGTPIEAFQQSYWDWQYGRMNEARALAAWVRRRNGPERADVITRLADVAEMLVATSLRAPEAAALRAAVDSESRHGCCKAPHSMNLALASAYEIAGDDRAALAALRRGKWDGPAYLAAYLLREGRLASRLGDRADAIRAYEHYLVLRSQPEAS
ncbi:MAG: protein kinase, partial [Gemmatimonadales bacterium]